MEILYMLLLMAAGFLLLLVMGWGPSYHLLGPDYRRYAPMVAPMAGLLIFCLVAVTVSGTFDMTVRASTTIAACALAGLSLLTALRRRDALGSAGTAWRDLAAISVVMVGVGFWSVLAQDGGTLYLGTVNPDYSQSLAFLETLIRYNLTFFTDYKALPGVEVDPFVFTFPAQLQARFAGVTFAYLLTMITGAEHRAALVTLIAVCLLCLPAAVYFFASALLGMRREASLLAAALVAVSGPIAMSLVHALVGQNSAIASVPLGLTLGYLAVKSQSTKLWLLFVLCMSGLIFVYVMMGPFIAAPVGAFALYRIVRDRKSFAAAFLKSMAVVLAVFVVINIGMAGTLVQFFKDLASLLGGIYQSHIYSEYLTERVIVYAMGVSAYPMSNSYLFRAFGPVVAGLVGVAAVICVLLYAFSIRLWSRVAGRDAVVFLVLAMAIYLAVGLYYTFVQPYGYSAFKMVSWLNCFVPPFMAYGMVRAWGAIKGGDPGLSRPRAISIFALMLLCYIALNVTSSVDYGIKSFGRDQQAGLINSYGIGDNPEWKEIAPALDQHTPKGSAIAIGLTDFVTNNWAAYYAYLARRDASYSSHGLFPDDDAFLPDLETGIVRDVKGRYFKDSRPFFKEGRADYYLLAGRKTLNREIVEPTVIGKAVWENDTVRLVEAREARDLLLTGRGFYRLEYVGRERLPWWYPDRFRWSGEGGEILHFNPAHPGEPNRISFAAVVGYGLPQDVRTLELFHNGKKFDEQTVYGAARVLSAPYYPTARTNTITIRIKEKTTPLRERWFSLWNPNIPAEWRLLNMSFAQVRVVPHEPAMPVGSDVDWKTMLEQSITFNGFNIDGWLREAAEFAVANPPGTTRLRIKFQIPGTPDYRFPFSIRFVVNGKPFVRQFEKPGENVAEFPLAEGDRGKVAVRIEPKGFKYTAAAFGERDLIQSIHLDAIAFER
jgi:hypothetical protein